MPETPHVLIPAQCQVVACTRTPTGGQDGGDPAPTTYGQPGQVRPAVKGGGLHLHALPASCLQVCVCAHVCVRGLARVCVPLCVLIQGQGT